MRNKYQKRKNISSEASHAVSSHVIKQKVMFIGSDEDLRLENKKSSMPETKKQTVSKQNSNID